MVRAGRRSLVEVDAWRLEVSVARDVDDPGPAVGQAVQQSRREGEVAEMVDPEEQLEPVAGQAPPAGHARIVDQDVQRLTGGQERLRRRPDRAEIGQVELQERDLVAAGGSSDGSDGRLALLLRPAGNVDAAAASGQRACGRQPDPGVTASD